MPEQKHKPLLSFILLLFVSIFVAGYVIYKNMPGSFRDFEYNNFFESEYSGPKGAVVASRLSFDGLQPTAISTVIWNNQEILAVACGQNIIICDLSGKYLENIALSSEIVALDLFSYSGQMLIGYSNGNTINIYSLENKEVIESYPSPASDCALTDLAITEEYVYVADGKNKCLWQYVRFNPVDGEILTEACPFGNKQFVIPGAYFELVYIPGESGLWAANTGKHQIQKYPFNGDEPEISWGVASFEINGFSGCCNPASFDIFPDGSFITSEKGVLYVKMFSKEGKFLTLLADKTDLTRPAAFKELSFPKVVAGRSGDKFFLLDPIEEEVVIFDLVQVQKNNN